MVQAIVFLPLLGAILAGLIALFGAHARNPSGDEVEHHDHGHHNHGPGDHAHAAAAHDDNGHDAHGHDDHHVSEPPAQGSRAAELITTGPVPDTPQPRARYGQPLSHAGRATAPKGN